jgi:hypothetical protein
MGRLRFCVSHCPCCSFIADGSRAAANSNSVLQVYMHIVRLLHKTKVCFVCFGKHHIRDYFKYEIGISAVACIRRLSPASQSRCRPESLIRQCHVGFVVNRVAKGWVIFPTIWFLWQFLSRELHHLH